MDIDDLDFDGFDDDVDDGRTYGCAGPGGWCAPLHLVERAVAGQSFARFFDVDHFMFGGRVARRGRPDVFLNKHIYTRRYLNLDEQGHAYRFLAPPEGSVRLGQYRPHRDLVTAIDALGLHEMPWLAPDLERERLGFTYDERWNHPDVVSWWARRAESGALTTSPRRRTRRSAA